MGEATKIEWCDHTFNPWLGCAHVSEGCRNCYAETLMDKRYGKAEWGKGKPRRLTSEANWKLPLRWDAAAEKVGERRRVFCASLADVFDEEVSDDWRDRLFGLIAYTRNLDWLLLTKRTANALRYINDVRALKRPLCDSATRRRGSIVGGLVVKTAHDAGWPNVWVGTSIENQKAADVRIPILLQIPVAIRFLSIEPLLGPIDLSGEWGAYQYGNDTPLRKTWLQGIQWAIVGGESGPGARPMHPQWARELRDQCTAARMPFFFKQWGEWDGGQYGACDDPCGSDVIALPNGTITSTEWEPGAHLRGGIQLHRVGKKTAGRLLDGRKWDELPTAVHEHGQSSR